MTSNTAELSHKCTCYFNIIGKTRAMVIIVSFQSSSLHLFLLNAKCNEISANHREYDETKIVDRRYGRLQAKKIK